jgi:hypothetical protein
VDKVDLEPPDADGAENSANEEVAELRDKMKKAKDLQDRTLSAYDDLDRTVRQVLAGSLVPCHSLLMHATRFTYALHSNMEPRVPVNGTWQVCMCNHKINVHKRIVCKNVFLALKNQL